MSSSVQELISKAYLAFQQGQLDTSKQVIGDILRYESGNLAAKELLAYVLVAEGNQHEAENLLLELALEPNASLSVLYEYGSLLLTTHPEKAIAVLERALQIAPNSFEVLHDLATAYACVGQKQLAVEKYSLAVQINSNSSELFYNLGRLYDDLFNQKMANACYQRALEIDPLFIKPIINLALNMNLSGRYDEGLNLLKSALEIEPTVDFLLGDCLHTKMQMGRWDEFGKDYAKVINGIKSGQRVIHPFHLLALADDPALQRTAAEIYASSRKSVEIDFGGIEKNASSKINIGYFSADFHNHPVAHLTAELFELHNKEQFKVFAFSSSKQEDEQKERLRRAFDEFIDIADLTDDEVVRLARSKGIHIAVDLGGYTEKARTGVFEKRAAPIQVSYLGYLGTLGSPHMDYILADHEVIPLDQQQNFSEKIVYLPDCYQINDRKRRISEKVRTRSEFNLPLDTFVYCCFNHSYKITPEVFSSWCNILQRANKSVLWIYESNQFIANNLRKEAKDRGIDPCRLVFGGVLSRPEYLARYRLADLFLDTFPYNAGTTASDALLVGLPVLTRSGKSFQSRMAGSILKAIGAPELVTDSIQDYEDLAVDLATNRTRLESIRKKIEVNKKTAPLFDSPKTTRNIENAYQEMYKLFLEGRSPSVIDLAYKCP